MLNKELWTISPVCGQQKLHSVFLYQCIWYTLCYSAVSWKNETIVLERKKRAWELNVALPNFHTSPRVDNRCMKWACLVERWSWRITNFVPNLCMGATGIAGANGTGGTEAEISGRQPGQELGKEARWLPPAGGGTGTEAGGESTSADGGKTGVRDVHRSRLTCLDLRALAVRLSDQDPCLSRRVQQDHWAVGSTQSIALRQNLPEPSVLPGLQSSGCPPEQSALRSSTQNVLHYITALH